MKILRVGSGDERLLRAGTELFDAPPTQEWAERFLSSEGHHLLLAVEDGDNQPVGFVSGVEMTHPDKGTEMFLYELSVAEGHRDRGIGRVLVAALADLARAQGCYGMWVLTDLDNAAALAAYTAAGAGPPEQSVLLEWVFRDRSSSA
jgi:ribosomal protein S18 acetylase RimI-like enzyme